jgi:hypothetical protein
MSQWTGLVFFLFFFSGCTSRTVVHPGGELIGNIQMPRIISYEELEYPRLAAEVSLEGEVDVLTTIDAYGKIKDMKILNSNFNYSAVYLRDGTLKNSTDIFHPLALKFINSMVFEPAKENGEPVEIEIVMPIQWKIKK